MELLYEFGIIAGITCLGEILHELLPLPVPASIYGLVLMLFALCTKLVKVDQVGRAGNFLIAIMPPMFIPSAVGLVTVWSELRPQLFPVVVITFVTTVLVMVVTGWVAQLVIRKKKGGEGHDRNTQ